MPHVLVVCTANICRSPVGEVLLRDRLHKRGLSDWTVSSAGTWADSGYSASRYSVELMEEQGLDLHQHSSQGVTRDLLAKTDLALCMETGHVEALRAEFPEYAQRIYALTEMSGPVYSISDPYGGPRVSYERMVREVTSLIEDGLPRIIELVQQVNAGA